jgi:hypothetical protein
MGMALVVVVVVLQESAKRCKPYVSFCLPQGSRELGFQLANKMSLSKPGMPLMRQLYRSSSRGTQ